MGFFSFLRRLFTRSTAQSGGSITVTSSGNGSLTTTLNRDDASMMRQLREAERYRDSIAAAAAACDLSVAILCGIGSRESHWGLALRPANPGGTGDFSQRRPRGARTGPTPPDGGGFGRGLMQIDYDWHEFARTGNWQDPHANLMYAAEVLRRARRFFSDRGVPEQQMTRAIIAAYNAGATATFKCYQNGADIDCSTTGRDYSADVLNRAGWFQLQGW